MSANERGPARPALGERERTRPREERRIGVPSDPRGAPNLDEQPRSSSLTVAAFEWLARGMTEEAASTPFEQLGGEWALRALINDFVDEMVDDPMIGFFFRGVDVHRLRDKEYEMTARFLGARVPYTGKGLREAHAPHPIMGGQFDRRRQILVEAMERHRVPANVRSGWLEHVDALRGVITRDASGECSSEPSPRSG